MLDNSDICYLYKSAKDKDNEVFILGQLTCSDADTIIEVLKDEGVYEEKQIQRCIKCKELYIEVGRGHICPSCRRKARYKRRRKNETRQKKM